MNMLLMFMHDGDETTEHFLLRCHHFAYIRWALLDQVHDVKVLPESRLVQILLYCDNNCNALTNKLIREAAIASMPRLISKPLQTCLYCWIVCNEREFWCLFYQNRSIHSKVTRDLVSKTLTYCSTDRFRERQHANTTCWCSMAQEREAKTWRSLTSLYRHYF